MPLNVGTRLGPYEIISAIGAGGMGEVYKARDTRLDRSVAIKVLPSHVASNPDLRQRFEREARAVAALNHPNICTLHDIGRQDGIDYLVMEYLEGRTLAQRLETGPLPLDQALQYAIQVADALDKAHRAGIVHRDLKPGNVMITKAGTKLLDFGLAKLRPGSRLQVFGSGPGTVSPTAMPTATAPLTGQGTILGTLRYMAPEQLEGKDADTRSDIFAFGAVVYEMLTGKKAFEGKNQASLIAAISVARWPPHGIPRSAPWRCGSSLGSLARFPGSSGAAWNRRRRLSVLVAG
jgi:serine/threonine protein kinase